MIETKDLIIDKAKQSDWKDMYYNVWRHPETAKYMMWSVTKSESDAEERMRRTIEFQKTHDTYLVYEKSSGRAIGFAGVEQESDGVFTETGICLGVDYVGKGYGKQIVGALIEYVKSHFGARELVYSSREENKASIALAHSMGFEYVSSEIRKDDRDNTSYNMLRFIKKLD